ncbi:hypothetical protein [Synechococcus sp. CS-1328]|uniref:hypothetical protein n=1 Tax=Synechococcus sp. CS-1328 TaxID=2847976 RepID=UPI00223B73D4|nr:hypothetical protein [Synechococcus sp. CS-1328]MCT0226131.1 hypothetical protein [Synechococcus sp. CS-1328]
MPNSTRVADLSSLNVSQNSGVTNVVFTQSFDNVAIIIENGGIGVFRTEASDPITGARVFFLEGGSLTFRDGFNFVDQGVFMSDAGDRLEYRDNAIKRGLVELGEGGDKVIFRDGSLKGIEVLFGDDTSKDFAKFVGSAKVKGVAVREFGIQDKVRIDKKTYSYQDLADLAGGKGVVKIEGIRIFLAEASPPVDSVSPFASAAFPPLSVSGDALAPLPPVLA